MQLIHPKVQKCRMVTFPCREASVTGAFLGVFSQESPTSSDAAPRRTTGCRAAAAALAAAAVLLLLLLFSFWGQAEDCPKTRRVQDNRPMRIAPVWLIRPMGTFLLRRMYLIGMLSPISPVQPVRHSMSGD